MKISKSKRQLAQLLIEVGVTKFPGGANWAAQDGSGAGFYSGGKPYWDSKYHEWASNAEDGACVGVKILNGGVKNHQQTVLSRDEFDQIVAEAALDTDGWIEWGGAPRGPVSKGTPVDVKMQNGTQHFGQLIDDEYWSDRWGGASIIAYRLHKPEQECATNKLSSEAVSAAKIALMSDSIEELVRKPTIEQLAADYRNAKDYANRKQQEADDAKAAADEALGELERAGEALGLVIGVAMPDPELVITDWRDLMERDVIWFDGDDEQAAGEYSVLEVEHANYGGNRAIRIDTIGNDYWIDVTDDWKFIRRP